MMPLDPVIAQIIPLMPLRDPDDHDSAKRARCAPRAGRVARRRSAAAGVERGRYGSEGRGGTAARRASIATRAEKSPTVVFFHGGGWVAGDLETHDRQARLLVIEAGAVVVSVDYRRPPETRFPGAFEDCFAAMRDIVARIAEFGGDAGRVGVAGDSAGGNLAAATAIACRDAGIQLAAQLLAYPVTDVAGNYADASENARFPSRAENAEGYFLSRAVMEWFAGHYLGDPSKAPTGAFRHCARQASRGWRPRSSARHGSIRCATRARPMPTRSPPPGSRRNITGLWPDPRLFRPWRCLGSRAARSATRARRFQGDAGAGRVECSQTRIREALA